MSGKGETAIAIILASALLATGGLLVIMDQWEEEWGTGMLPTFKDQEQMERFVQRSQDNDIWDVFASEMAGDSAASGQEVRHSTTNIQVEGVDEADCVKTDGQFLYIASHDTISVVRAYPLEQLSNSSSINIHSVLGLGENYSVWIQGIYISEERLIAVASVNGPFIYYPYHDGAGSENSADFAPVSWRMPEERTVAVVFALSQSDPPSLIGWIGLSGYGITSRMTSGTLYLVTQHYIWMYDSDVSTPKEWQGNDSSGIAATSVHYDPECNDPASFLNIMALDVGSMDSNVTSILTGYASTIYVSQSAMYLSYQKWSGSGDDIVSPIRNEAGTSSSVAVSSDSATTTIYRIALNGLRVEPQARGDVPGYLLNQFSLDESNGMLRVATTFSWGNERSSVYVLDGNMEIIGALEDLAPGERIYSSRFMGDTLYLVTFRQVDPLFVIDLSDPASPQVLGELKVPGFSSYLHPVGEGRLVGIGMENGSVKVSLFDVSDPYAPSEVNSVLVPGWSNSDALWDHKAVTYDPATGSLIIPVTSWDRSSWNCTSGAFVFVIAEEGVELKGVVEPEFGEYTMRAQYIGDHLYTITDTTVYVNSLLDLSAEGKLVYRERYYDLVPWLMGAGEVVAIGAVR